MPRSVPKRLQAADKPKCPVCGRAQSMVTDSRPVRSSDMLGDTIRRRRKCLDCDARWTTYELESSRVETTRALLKKVGRLEGALRNLSAEIELALSWLEMEDDDEAECAEGE